MKLLTLTCTFLLALSNMPSMADELPTCRWLHLDRDTRVYQCAVLPPEVMQPTNLMADSLPDPTQPIAQQAAVPSESLAYIIPDFLRESMVNLEPVAAPTITAAPVTTIAPAIVKTTALTTVSTTAASPISVTASIPDTIIAVPVVEAVLPVIKIAVVANGEIESVKALMQASDDEHFYVLPKSGRLSLGVYSSPAYAKRRQAAMMAMGIETELMTLGQKILPNLTPIISRQIEAGVPRLFESELELSSRSVLKAKLQPSLQPKITVSGYLVAAVGNQKDLVAELKRIRVTDFVALTADPYRNRVSLGVYSHYKNALARQNYFKQLGIDSDLILRNESIVVRSTLPPALPPSLPIEQEIKTDDVPYGYNQIALRPLEI